MNKKIRRLLWHLQRTGLPMKTTCPCCGQEIITQATKNSPNSIERTMFETFRLKYKGKKRGLDTELSNFIKHKDWRQVLPKLDRMDIKWGCETKYIPHLATFINQRRWEMIEDVKPTVNPYGEQHDWRTE